MKFKNLYFIMAAVATLSALLSCQKSDTMSNKLEVSSAKGLEFKASDNRPVTLTITTDAESWSYEAPEWAGASKGEDGSSLVINPQTNTTGKSRAGRILIKAGTAHDLKINIVQYSESGSELLKIKATIIEAENSQSNDIAITLPAKDPKHSTFIKVVLDNATDRDIEFKLIQDESYAKEYSFIHDGITCLPIDAGHVTIANEGKIRIAAGKTESDPIEVSFTANESAPRTKYIVSITADADSTPEGLKFTYGQERITWCISRGITKEVKNVVYIEANDTNPLNILEYRLEDGTPFFDVVILFAANINYSDDRGVYLHNNANIQALLSENADFIQPLREAGIEVQLGLLPNHTPAGLCNLSRKGADRYAEDVVDAMATYRLDGVNMDEEYQSGTTDSDLIGNTENDGGMYLCWKIKQLMREQCSWPTSISIFDYNWKYDGSVVVDGKTYQPSEFIDFTVANYGQQTYPFGNLSKKAASGKSIETNNRDWALSTDRVDFEDEMRQLKNNGFGYVMWFALNPQPNRNTARTFDPFIMAAARGLYDLELVKPTHYYDKLGEGKYSVERKERNW